MRAGLRFTIMLAAAGLGLGPASALAQSTTEPPATSNAPATDAVGPRELQNFSLPGTTTRPADQPAQAPRPPVVRRRRRATAPAPADQRRSPAAGGAFTGEPGRTGTDQTSSACCKDATARRRLADPVFADATEPRAGAAVSIRPASGCFIGAAAARSWRPNQNGNSRFCRGCLPPLRWRLGPACSCGAAARAKPLPAVRKSTCSQCRNRPRAPGRCRTRRLRPLPRLRSPCRHNRLRAPQAGSSPRVCGRRLKSGCSRCAASSPTIKSRSSSRSIFTTPAPPPRARCSPRPACSMPAGRRNRSCPPSSPTRSAQVSASTPSRR